VAHYAFLDENNIVTQVIVGRNEDEIVDGISDWESHYAEIVGQRCIRTSYNGRIRGRYASIGYLYDEERDLFIAPQPFPSWITDERGEWVAPVPYPEDNSVFWVWSESEQRWTVSVFI
jgi:hypothetical protein